MRHTQTTYMFRFVDLVARGIVNNRMTLQRWMQRDKDPFPAPIRLGVNTVAWRASDVEEWLDRLAAREAQIEQLLNREVTAGSAQ